MDFCAPGVRAGWMMSQASIHAQGAISGGDRPLDRRRLALWMQKLVSDYYQILGFSFGK
jgi:hypothetical protein